MDPSKGSNMTEPGSPTPGFQWTTINAVPLLPPGWSHQLVEIAERDSAFRLLETSSTTSREETPFLDIPSLTVDGELLNKGAPWLYELYRGLFRNLAAEIVGTSVECAKEDLYGAVLNVQRGSQMRYECHVDSNPLQGLLYVTSHAPGEGGELAVAANPNAHSVKEVDADCDVI